MQRRLLALRLALGQWVSPGLTYRNVVNRDTRIADLEAMGWFQVLSGEGLRIESYAGAGRVFVLMAKVTAIFDMDMKANDEALFDPEKAYSVPKPGFWADIWLKSRKT